MSRVIWKGAVSFSSIHIPVSLYAASRDAALDFDLLDKRDFGPVGYQRCNKVRIAQAQPCSARGQTGAEPPKRARSASTRARSSGATAASRRRRA